MQIKNLMFGEKKVNLKNKLFTAIILSLFFVNLSQAQFSQPQQERDLELTRRETAVSEKIQRQIEQVLGNYYKKDTFLVNIKAYLERIPLQRVSTKQPANTEIETDLPGLPFNPEELTSREMEKFVIDKWTFSDKFKIKYIDASILLDEKAFSLKDIDFVRTVAQARIGIDENRGDIIASRAIPFPPPVNAVEMYREKQKQEVIPQKSLLKEIYPYLYFGGAFVAFLLFLIILLQVINILKPKKHTIEPPFNYGYQLPPKNQSGPFPFSNSSYPPQNAITPEPFSPSTLKQQTAASGVDENMFYELRQLMVTTLIGNPKLASEVFKKWVAQEQDNGIYQIAGFLKATDPKLIDVLSEHLGSEISSKTSFAINQMTSVDKESLVETLKKFREEFQQEQVSSFGKNTEDTFDFLKQLNSEQIFHLIKDEPVGIMAIALAQITPEIANAVFKELPIEKQSRIPTEIGKLKKIPVSAYKDIADKLSKKAIDVKKIKYVTTDGVDALGNFLEQSSPEKEQEILASIALHDIQIADELRKVYITFDEITRIPDKMLSEILRSFDRELITRALIDTDPDLKVKILSSLPQRMKIMIGDEVKSFEESGEIPIDEIQKARRTITQKIREMAKSGLIDLHKLFGQADQT